MEYSLILFFVLIFFVVILNQAVRSQLAKDKRILTQNIVITSVRVYADASPAKSKFTQSSLQENIILLFIFF